MNSKKNNPKKVVEKKVATVTNTKSVNQSSASSTNNISTISLANEHIISKNKGSKMVKDFIDVTTNNLMPFSINKCYDFNKEIFDLILSDANSKGIRIYFGINDQNALSIIFTGIDSKKDDIYIPLNPDLELLLNDKLGAADMGQVCVPALYNSKNSIIQLP